jgi:hypothetical protein
VGSTTGNNYYVRILTTLNRELLKPSSSVALHRHSNALVDILPPEADSSISLLSQSERPDVTYQASDESINIYFICQTFARRIPPRCLDAIIVSGPLTDGSLHPLSCP